MNGERIQHGNGQTTWRLLDAVTGLTPGFWVNTEGYEAFSVEITGLERQAAVIVSGSNEPDRPSGHGTPLAPTVKANAFLDIQIPMSWIKCRVVKHTLGVITVTLQGRHRWPS